MLVATDCPRRVERGPGHFTVRVDDGLLLIDFRGTITRKLYVAACAALSERVSRGGIHAIHGDMSKALLGMSAEQMQQNREFLKGLSVPGSLVLSEIAVEIGQLWAWNSAKNGLVRRVFTDRAEALAWARGHVLLARHPVHRLQPDEVFSALWRKTA
jgi:hypothetical protein